MRTGKATRQDIETALALNTFLESLDRGYVPESASSNAAGEYLYVDDGEQCCRIVESLVRICRKGSVGRVISGMATVCDPKNEVIDPDADFLQLHPKHLNAAQHRDALLSALYLIVTDNDGNGFVSREAMEHVRRAIAFAEGDHKNDSTDTPGT